MAGEALNRLPIRRARGSFPLSARRFLRVSVEKLKGVRCLADAKSAPSSAK